MQQRLSGGSKALRIGLIIHKAPPSSQCVESILRIAAECLKDGCRVDVFAIGDGVWLAWIKGHRRVQATLQSILSHGGRIFVSEPCLKAAGVGSKLPKGWAKIDAVFSTLVDLIMGEWDRVIVI